MFRWSHNFQIVGYREHPGYTLGCYLGESLVRSRVNVAFQGHVPVFDDDVNGWIGQAKGCELIYFAKVNVL